MKNRKIRNIDVSALGLGCMSMTKAACLLEGTAGYDSQVDDIAKRHRGRIHDGCLLQPASYGSQSPSLSVHPKPSAAAIWTAPTRRQGNMAVNRPSSRSRSVSRMASSPP